MPVYTAPSTLPTGFFVTASVYNTDLVENIKYFKDSPVFDGDITVGDDIFLASTGAVINFASGDVTITHSTNALTFAGATSGYVFNDGNVGIGGTPGSVRLDLIGLVDAVRVSSSTTNSTTKEGKFLTRHYTNSEEDFLLAYGYSTSTDNGIAFGGGSGSQNAATLIGFYTAANNTTVSGTERLRINSSGHVGIGATARFYLDGVAGTGNTYQEESASDVYQLVVGGTTKLRAAQTGISVSTSATTIIPDAGGLGSFVVVNGNDGSNRFCDLVLASTSTAPTVVSSYTSLGSPAARTYTRSSDALQLAMGSGTYAIHTVKLGS